MERVGKGNECGIVLEGFADFRQGDVIQCVGLQAKKPKTEAVFGGGVRVLDHGMDGGSILQASNC